MTDRWLNYVLSVVVVVGMIGVAVYNQPRDRQERAEFLDQELTEVDDAPSSDEVRAPVELQRRADRDEPRAADEPDAESEGPVLAGHGVSASHPQAVDVGMQVLDGGGNAVDAAIAVAYALGVVEPFGSGIGGGGSMLVQPADGPARYFDYREVAPASGRIPPSDIGVPGFVLGMETVHGEFGEVELTDLVEYAARLAEDGFEVDTYLNERLRAAAHRMPIHLLPRLFPDNAVIGVGATLRQPEYAAALRLIQEQGAEVMYRGELAEQIVDAVEGLEREDLAHYEVLELEPAVGVLAGYEIVSGGAPVSGPPLVQLLQIAEAGGVADLDPDAADSVHLMAQAWRVANDQRSTSLGDPTMEDVDLAQLLGRDHTDALASQIPPDGFASVEDDQDVLGMETDTTHVVVVDRQGTMVSMTNTLSNFFGSGLPVSGFFLNDQLKNFSPEPDSINHVAPGKRPRSFVAPTIVLEDGQPVLGIGSPGGRRIPNIVAQVLVRWALLDQPLEDAVAAPRFHLEGRRLELEAALGTEVTRALAQRGYEITLELPSTEYFGGVQILGIDWASGEVYGVRDERRVGDWAVSDN